MSDILYNIDLKSLMNLQEQLISLNKIDNINGEIVSYSSETKDCEIGNLLVQNRNKIWLSSSQLP